MFILLFGTKTFGFWIFEGLAVVMKNFLCFIFNCDLCVLVLHPSLVCVVVFLGSFLVLSEFLMSLGGGFVKIGLCISFFSATQQMKTSVWLRVFDVIILG